MLTLRITESAYETLIQLCADSVVQASFPDIIEGLILKELLARIEGVAAGKTRQRRQGRKT